MQDYTTTAYSFTGSLFACYRPMICYEGNAVGEGYEAISVSQNLAAMDGAAEICTGFYVGWTNADHSAGILHAFGAEDITGDAQADEYAFRVGTGWDYALYAESGNIRMSNGETISNSTDGRITVNEDFEISGDDLYMATNTDAAILVADGTNYNPVVPAMSEFVPIGWFVFDGTTDPGDETEEDNIRYRDFAGTVASEEGEFQWMAPGNLSGSTVKVRAIGLITNATAPANTEGVSWAIAAVSAGGDDSHDLAVGAEANSEDTDLDDQASAQWDLVFFPYVEVTPTNLAAGELVKISVTRDIADADDTYEQDIGLVGVEIKYAMDLATQTY